MYKQVVVVRRDLKLDKGKLAVQVAHASIDAYNKSDPDVKREWEDTGSKKVVLRVDGIRELIVLHKKAKELKLPCSLIKDAGKTHIPPGTVTALGIGPCRDDDLDMITGNLKML
ncbi:peptidyl-tRNA hydrolase Pth2 [Candidatus Aenigmatarchaeota archaeon]